MPQVSQPTVVRTATLTVLAMLAFAANSLLCRAALRGSSIDPAGFTLLRLLAGALVLWMLVRWRHGGRALGGSWPSAAVLFLGEALELRLLLASVAILGGIALVIARR